MPRRALSARQAHDNPSGWSIRAMERFECRRCQRPSWRYDHNARGVVFCERCHALPKHVRDRWHQLYHQGRLDKSRERVLAFERLHGFYTALPLHPYPPKPKPAPAPAWMSWRPSTIDSSPSITHAHAIGRSKHPFHVPNERTARDQGPIDPHDWVSHPHIWDAVNLTLRGTDDVFSQELLRLVGAAKGAGT